MTRKLFSLVFTLCTVCTLTALGDDSGDAPSVSGLDTSNPAPSSTSGDENVFLDKTCRSVTSELVSQFRNPSYPGKENGSVVCHHLVRTQEGYCGLRVDFMEATFTPPLEGCSTDTFQILGTSDTPAVIHCGFLAGHQFTVKTDSVSPTTLLVTSQSQSSWSVKVTQLSCSSVKGASALLPKQCGIPGDPASALRNDPDEVKVIEPAELLRTEKSPLFQNPDTRRPEAMLWRTLLEYKRNLKIVNGNETGVNEFPWQVLLLVGGKPICGGSLITDQYVLTAGHCASVMTALPNLASLLIVDLGDHDLTSSTESQNRVYKVDKVIPNIHHDVVLSDIALLKLKRKVELTSAIAPICVPLWAPAGITYEDRVGVTSGWGKTSDGSVISPVLRKAELKIIPLETCKELWELVGVGGGELINDGMICAGGGPVGPCNGDSGGPLMVKDDTTGKYTLVGVTSFGSLRGCALAGVPTVFTRVTTFIDWIILNIAEN